MGWSTLYRPDGTLAKDFSTVLAGIEAADGSAHDIHRSLIGPIISSQHLQLQHNHTCMPND